MRKGVNNNATLIALLFLYWSGDAAEDGVAEERSDGAAEGGALVNNNATLIALLFLYWSGEAAEE
jgi:hypothetical protein